MARAERRGFERIEYAPGLRPAFVVGGHSFEVLDCAERGLRYRPSPQAATLLPDVGSDVRGAVRFPDGHEVPVDGVVVRAGDDGVAVHFTQLWIDKRIIERERRRLRAQQRHVR